MAEETRERSTTSAGLWPEAVIGDLNNDSCWLYLMKGLGSDRDKRLALGVLRAFLQTITGEFKVVGNNGSATLTNLLLSMVAEGGWSSGLSAQEITFIDTALAGWSAKFGRAGLEISAGETEGSLKFTISAAGVLTITEGTGQNVKTVTISKDGIQVVGGSLSSPSGAIASLSGNTLSYGKMSTPCLRRTYVNQPIVYTLQGTQGGIDASTIQSTLTSSSVLQFIDGISASGPRNINLDWTPAADTELVIDFQSVSADRLVVNNGSGTSSPIINQAPNTVRRFRYSGSAWECLY